MADGKQEMSLPQLAVAAIAGFALLWIMTALAWFAIGADSWNQAEKRWKTKAAQRQREEKAIKRTAHWRAAYEKERTRMPEFEDGVDLSSHWLGLVEEVTGANNLRVTSRRTIKGSESETREGEVCEQQIEIVKWEATLENLLRAMYAFESAKGEMIDIRKIAITPNAARKGFMSGSMTLTCAYTRQAPGKTARAARTSAPEQQASSTGAGK